MRLTGLGAAKYFIWPQPAGAVAIAESVYFKVQSSRSVLQYFTRTCLQTELRSVLKCAQNKQPLWSLGHMTAYNKTYWVLNHHQNVTLTQRGDPPRWKWIFTGSPQVTAGGFTSFRDTIPLPCFHRLLQKVREGNLPSERSLVIWSIY